MKTLFGVVLIAIVAQGELRKRLIANPRNGGIKS